MCTVTFVPNADGFVFTSNRDEQPSRKTLAPQLYMEHDQKVMYPKDEVAGGTWIGASENKRLVCLLNGGFHYHDPKIKFPKSRGTVVKNLLTVADVDAYVADLDLSEVAPFTLLVIDWNDGVAAKQLVWCKKEKHFDVLDVTKKHILSSSTLYTQEMKGFRKKWLEDYFENKTINKEHLVNFHQDEKLGGDIENTPKMKREVVETISTTQVSVAKEELQIRYIDYVNDLDIVHQQPFEKLVVENE